MESFRISKYNPEYRIDGKYLKNEWTDFSDIGDKFDGQILTEEEYQRVENNYILCILELLSLAKISTLCITELEKYELIKWENGQILLFDNIPKILCDCLRNKCWCKLRNNETYVDFGYDYYVHIGVELSFDEVERICNKYSLYCENWSIRGR